DRLAVRVRVPRRPRARCEVDAARAQARRAGGLRDLIQEDRAREPVARSCGGPSAAPPRDLHHRRVTTQRHAGPCFSTGMRAAVMYGAGDVRVETVPDARLSEPTDALVRVTRAAICGSDLWPYNQMEASEAGRRMGHEFVGVVEAVGDDVRTLKTGDLVVAPFLWSDGTCVFCRAGLHSSCLHGGGYGRDGVDGGQGEAVRVPHADGTLVPLPVGPDDELMPSLLTLADVMSTGHHAARSARVRPGG